MYHYKRILMNFFCLVHQHGCHGLWHTGPTGMSENALQNLDDTDVKGQVTRHTTVKWPISISYPAESIDSLVSGCSPGDDILEKLNFNINCLFVFLTTATRVELDLSHRTFALKKKHYSRVSSSNQWLTEEPEDSGLEIDRIADKSSPTNPITWDLLSHTQNRVFPE